MIFSQKDPASSRIFYGWYILTAGFFLLFFQSGARFSFGIMFKPMIAELGWNRASISSVFFLNMVFFTLTLSVAGRLYGFAHVGLISGFITTVHHLGGGFWAYMGGLLFDKTGSYLVIFVISAAMAIVAIISILLLKEKRFVLKGNH
jgi:hypothetical protein